MWLVFKLLVILTWLGTASRVYCENQTYLMPIHCAELLPDNKPYVDFFESVAKGQVSKDRVFSKRLFKILEIRNEFRRKNQWVSEQGLIDILIRKTLCFYREQKEPLATILFDDSTFISYLKESVLDLEKKIQETLYEIELKGASRKIYEQKLRANQALVNQIKAQAKKEAEHTYSKIKNDAQKTAKKNAP